MGYGFSKDVRLVKDWLKSLHPQPKSGWDKTDKVQLLQIIEDGVTKSLCKKGFHFHFNEEYAKDLIEYICSFNLSKSNWKPSSEQIEALKDAKIRMSLDGYGLCPLLQTLIDDLEKL